MLGNLSPDLIGTDPKYPAIVNHGWLDVNPANYDNYPSDNNPVRIQPKLSQLWNHEPQPVAIIPNSTVQPLGLRSADQTEKQAQDAVRSVVREAKKVIMAGMRGRSLADHIRARFSTKDVEMAGEELKKLSSEIGLLGNVYIDASAFSTYDEAAKFLSQHKNRLSRNILFDADNMNASVVARLASEFRKNVVISMEYDEKTLKGYKDYLTASGRIPEDFEVDSKEALRSAFLYEAPDSPVEASEPEEHHLNGEEMEQGLNTLAVAHSENEDIFQDGLLLKRIFPVLGTAQESYSKGKDAEGVKEILRKRFSSDDIKAAAPMLTHIASMGGLSVEGVKSLKNISEAMSVAFLKLAKDFPVKVDEWEGQGRQKKAVGTPGYLYAPIGGKSANKAVEKAVEAMKRGMNQETLKAKLIEAKLSKEEVGQVMVEAMAEFNASPAGSVANRARPPVKAKLVEDPAPKQTLPDPDTIMPQMKEMISFYQGADLSVDVGAPQKSEVIEIGEIFNREGLDSVL